ncbi:kinase-like domain-containing protein [Podospora aff. communis PSN243]|uniref:Kinase-like domain-containing protein n=1 Tax=Podospora aff. communis PSN243 TaxID=3040156 RepID=A0AAV9G6T6_9PEZI|nr:kinase-like domain-containing protein [Podospora aff. communis PSN243]
MLTIRSQPEPLHKQLESGAVHCGLAGDQSSRFLPESHIIEKVTKGSIEANLTWRSWLASRLPTTDSIIDRIHDQAKKVFTILSLIGQEHTISDLIYKDNITDKDLPLVPRNPGESVLIPKESRKGETVKEFSSFASWDERRVRDFLDKQWLVLAPILDVTGKELNLDPRCPLPFKEIELMVRSNGVFVHKATLHPAHQLWSDAAIPEPSVAIKEIHDEAVFSREKENLEEIKDLGHPHLIKLLATCQRGSFRCFIFPWAEGGNLWNFWEREDEIPRTTDFVLWLLGQVFGIIDAIRVLHEKNIRHGDIKPQNILHFVAAPRGKKNDRWGRFVLADVGVSKMHKHVTLKRNEATNTVEVTLLYEAPEAEYDRKNGQPRSRRYDMWSSGCMLLEFVVWLLYGFGAVSTFRSRRRSSKGDPTTAPGNFFRQEKGKVKIHSMVKKALELLRADPRCEKGTALAELLDLIENRLLKVRPEERAEATELHDKLQELVEKSRANPSFLWKGIDTPVETPKFFVRSKSRQNSNSSVVSSGSSVAVSSGSSGWMQRTGGSSGSADSFGST